jgi:hypothetical protein
MQEEWKAVIGFEGWYEVSTQGRVRSLERTVEQGAPYMASGKKLLRLQGTILKPYNASRYGHKNVRLYMRKEGKRGFKDSGVHRLVLEAFVGPPPEGMECRHLNGNASDNRLDNLAWGTHQQNMDDREGHCRHQKGSMTERAKLTEADIPYIRSRKSKEWGAMSRVAREFGVDAATIRDIWIGKTWKHVP